MAFHAVRCAGEGDAFVAAGVESVTQVNGRPETFEELHPKLIGDENSIANVYIPMGLTAENVAERGRSPATRWTASPSDPRACRRRQDSGFFGREIVAYDKVGADDGPRRESTFEKLAGLQPVFKPDGSVTAGNSCPAQRRCSRRRGDERHPQTEARDQARARIIASSVTGVDPRSWGWGRSRRCARCSRGRRSPSTSTSTSSS